MKITENIFVILGQGLVIIFHRVIIEAVLNVMTLCCMCTLKFEKTKT